VTEGGLLLPGTDSTTSALHYGFKPDGLCLECPPGIPSCSLPAGSASAYAGSEDIFRQMPPIIASSNSWLVMMLTSSSLAQAKAVVDRGVASDGAFPTQTVYLIHYDADPFRGVRYLTYDDSVFDNRLRGDGRVVRTNIYSPAVLGYQLGSQFGWQSFSMPAGLFTPGAMADNLTSYGGYIFDSVGHTGPLDYLNAGATASYGTIVEPCNYLEKFPSPRNYFYQARGFSVAECYYLSVTNPYQGLLLGEPLSAPFALPCSGSWNNLPANSLLGGTTNLSVQSTAADASRPVQQVDFFVDGTFARTLTNVAPRSGNVLYVTLNGFTTNYTVTSSTTIKSVASSLAAVLNTASYTNATKVRATVHGDRISLQSLDIAKRGPNVSLAVSNFAAGGPPLTTHLSASGPGFVESIALGVHNFFVTNMPASGSFLQMAVTGTNGGLVTVSVTNPPGNTDTSLLVKMLHDAINTNSSLQAADGVVAEDFFSYDFWYAANGWHAGEFNLLSRTGGWAESQIQAHLTGSANFIITPSATVKLDDNVNDLRPRAHLYVAAGLPNLPVTFAFNTTTQADGFHELIAVAYEGSHVRTQKRISQNVRIQNTTLSATFTSLVDDASAALETMLRFSVVANTNNITKIELFSTGGALATSNGVSSATFAIAATNLGIGLHPFYALVTRADNKQYRTETKWIRIVGAEPPFPLSVAGATPTLAWPATAGRRYEVLSTINVTDTFLLRDAVTPTNSQGQWSETNNSASQRFYRVRTAQ